MREGNRKIAAKQFWRELALGLSLPWLVWPWVPDIDASSLSWTGLFIFLFLAPLCEEQVFRGWLQGWLAGKPLGQRRWLTFSAANLFTSVAFVAAHAWTQPLALLPGYFVASVFLGRVKELSGRLEVAVLLHIYFNALTLRFS